jgi:hypothetical protein
VIGLPIAGWRSIGNLDSSIGNRQSDRQSPIANRIATHYSSIVDPIGNRQSHIFN